MSMSLSMNSLLMLLMLTAAVSRTKAAAIEYVDLAHIQSNESVPSLPGTPPYNLTNLFRGIYAPTIYFELNYIGSPEHSGTHVDVPANIFPDGISLEEIPLESYIAEGIVIDASREAAEDNNYGITVEKIKDWERRNGPLPRKAAVLLRFDWDLKYDNENDFKGTDDLQNPLTYVFPHMTVEAYQYLIERYPDIKIIGTDTISPDPVLVNGSISGLPIQRDLLGREGNPGVSVVMLRNLRELPPRGFMFYATPVKYDGATGTQVRAFATVMRPCCRRYPFHFGK